jgi:arylsulfatase
MNNFTEKTWFLPNVQDEISEFMKTYAKYPPRKLQSNIYTGPITITDYERLEIMKERIKNYKVGTAGGM